jgi:cytochrome c oxidase assembly protein subunit 15
VSSSLAVPAGLPATTTPQRWLRPVLVANLVAQSGIVLTGGLVRLTASGLGCTTWPNCVPGSFTPVAHQAQGWHKWVEFTNRLAVGLLIAAAIGVFMVIRAYLRQTGSHSRLIFWLSLAPMIGVLAQSVIGGITVWVTLAPIAVMLHFLPSMVLVSCAMALLLLVTPASAEPVPARPEIRRLTYALAVTASVVLVLGTVVTGSGPHSGDQNGRADRFAFDPRTVSWLHADSVWLFVGLAIAVAVALRLVPSPVRARKSSVHLIYAIVLQGAIGYVQYATGLPTGVVAAHLLGSTLIAAGTTAVVVETLRRRPALEATES